MFFSTRFSLYFRERYRFFPLGFLETRLLSFSRLIPSFRTSSRARTRASSPSSRAVEIVNREIFAFKSSPWYDYFTRLRVSIKKKRLPPEYRPPSFHATFERRSATLVSPSPLLFLPWKGTSSRESDPDVGRFQSRTLVGGDRANGQAEGRVGQRLLKSAACSTDFFSLGR